MLPYDGPSEDSACPVGLECGIQAKQSPATEALSIQGLWPGRIGIGPKCDDLRYGQLKNFGDLPDLSELPHHWSSNIFCVERSEDQIEVLNRPAEGPPEPDEPIQL